MSEESGVDTAGPTQPKPPSGEVDDRLPSPVKDFDLEKAPDDRRTFANGDTDRNDDVG
jgi:hypothetical protein